MLQGKYDLSDPNQVSSLISEATGIAMEAVKAEEFPEDQKVEYLRKSVNK